MDPMYIKTKSELFAAVSRALNDATIIQSAHMALKEIERRYDARKVLLAKYELSARGAKLVQHLERALADGREFERVHNTVANNLAQQNVSRMGIVAVTTMRDNAENRAWQYLSDWIEHAPKKPEHAGSTYDVRTGPVSPGHGTDWDAAIWRQFWNEGKDELDSEVVATKRGTSRVDALAHLASWCQVEAEEALPTAYCGHDGPCGLGVPKCVQELATVQIGVPSTEHPRMVAKYKP